jgi:hypothetical protein
VVRFISQQTTIISLRLIKRLMSVTVYVC